MKKRIWMKVLRAIKAISAHLKTTSFKELMEVCGYGQAGSEYISKDELMLQYKGKVFKVRIKELGSGVD